MEINPDKIIFDVMDTGIFVIDRNLEIEIWNPWMEEKSNFRKEEVLGKNLFALYPNLLDRGLEKRYREVLDNGNFVILSQVFHKYLIPFNIIHGYESEYFEYMQQYVKLIPIKIKGEVVSVLTTIVDVTSFLVTEKKLMKSREKLRRAFREMEVNKARLIQSGKIMSLGRMISGMLDDLNNPVNMVYQNIGALKDYLSDIQGVLNKYASLSSITPEELNEINMIKGEVEYDEMINDLDILMGDTKSGMEKVKRILSGLIEFSRLDSGVVKGVNVNNLIDESIDFLITKSRVEIKRSYSELPQYRCYVGQIKQVIMNILSYSIQFSKKGGEIRIETQMCDSDLLIGIRNSGYDFPVKDIEEIFDTSIPVEALKSNVDRNFLISRLILERHNGRLDVKQIEGEKGIEFTIVLPVGKD